MFLKATNINISNALVKALLKALEHLNTSTNKLYVLPSVYTHINIFKYFIKGDSMLSDRFWANQNNHIKVSLYLDLHAKCLLLF